MCRPTRAAVFLSRAPPPPGSAAGGPPASESLKETEGKPQVRASRTTGRFQQCSEGSELKPSSPPPPPRPDTGHRDKPRPPRRDPHMQLGAHQPGLYVPGVRSTLLHGQGNGQEKRRRGADAEGRGRRSSGRGGWLRSCGMRTGPQQGTSTPAWHKEGHFRLYM